MEKLQIFSNNLKLLRKRLRLKQDQVLDIKPSTWSNYEQGSSTPVIKDLIRICQFFGISETQVLHNPHLIEDIESGKIQVNSTPNSTPNYTPNPEIYLQFNEEQGLYMKKNEADIVLTHMRDTMKTKDALITALDRENAMLRAQLDECKKALKAG